MDLTTAHLKSFGAELMKLSEDKSKLLEDVAKKLPHLTKEKNSNMEGPESYGAAKLPSTFEAPSVLPTTKKQASAAGALGKMIGPTSRVGKHLTEHAHAYDLAGLGVLAAPSAMNLAEQASNKAKGQTVNRKEVRHSLAEVGGLGILAAPVAAGMLAGRH